MGAAELLRLVVDADVQGAVSGLKKVGDTTTKELGKSQKTIDRWGKGFSKAGVGMIGFGAAALVGLGKAAKASEEARLSTVKLQTSVANNPRLNAQSAKSFEDLAQSIQNKTAADGDDITAGIAVLAQSKLSEAQMRRLIPLVVDLARAKGMDETAAFTLATKAVSGNVGALRRAGIQVDATKAKTDAYGATMDALRGSVGGFSEREGKTFAGSLERMKNQLHDLEEGVGAGAVDAFTTMFSVVGKTSVELNKISPGAQSAIGKVAAFGAAGLIAAGATSTLIGQLIKMRTNFAALGSGISSMSSKLGGLSGPAGIAGIAAAVGALAFEANRFTDSQTKFDASKIADQLTAVGTVSDESGRRFVTMADKLGLLDSGFKKLLDASVPAAERFLDLAKSAGVSKDKIAEMSKELAAKKAADIGATRAQTDYSDSVQKGAEALDGQATSAEKAAKAITDQSDAVAAAFDPLFGMVDALQQNAEASAKVDEATRNYLKAVKAHGPLSKEAAAAEQELTAAREASGKSALGVTSATAKLNAQVAQQPSLLADAKKQLDVWVQQGLISKATAAQLGTQLDNTALKAIALGRTDPKVDVAVTGLKPAISGLGFLNSLIGGIPSHKTVAVQLTLGGDRAAELAALSHRAGGGRVTRNVPSIVGEQGPEIFVPDASGVIIPNSRLSAVSGGGMSSTTYAPNVTINVNGGDPQAVVTALRQYMRANGPVPISVKGQAAGQFNGI